MICDGGSNSWWVEIVKWYPAFKRTYRLQNSCYGANDGIVCADVEHY